MESFQAGLQPGLQVVHDCTDSVDRPVQLCTFWEEADDSYQVQHLLAPAKLDFKNRLEKYSASSPRRLHMCHEIAPGTHRQTRLPINVFGVILGFASVASHENTGDCIPESPILLYNEALRYDPGSDPLRLGGLDVGQLSSVSPHRNLFIPGLSEF